MVRGDAAQLLVAGVGPDAAEEGADLPLPLLQVGAEQGRPLALRDLGRGEPPALAAPDGAPAAADAHVPHPLGVAAGRDQVAVALELERVDRGLPPLAALSPLHFQHPRPGDADPQPRQAGDDPVEDMLGEPARLLEAGGPIAHSSIVADQRPVLPPVEDQRLALPLLPSSVFAGDDPDAYG